MTNEQILYLALIFVAVASGVIGVGLIVTRGSEVRERLRGLTAGGTVLDQPAEVGEWQAKVVKVAAPVAKLATPTSEEEVSNLRAKFLHAGIRSPSAPVLYFAAKALLAAILPLLFVFVTRSVDWKLSTQTSTALLLLLAAIGYYLPNVVLARMTALRQRDLFEAFPDALDLMIVCVEAGLGLDMAINKTAEEMKLRSPVLAEELEMMALELRVGSSRERALRNLAMRTGLEEISTFATMLIQADRFGTSLAESLRVHADMLRTRRRLRAEEAAAKIPLKLLFPLIFCIFPSLLLVLLGPAFIQIYRIMIPTMQGGG
ncbi:type II secretion system F family protein [Burkholderiaceae bacterium FT117]|uniref:type II secretion system F family protein n=1 Tax=Zeimonas sediminis TaxID=2944268 RepID=UPI0023430E7E|nr:type II secretion system F family protein [Zeimonas sediminis]MCM5572077.1 type II secretion system F family protein [Zeimonas sediminis]